MRAGREEGNLPLGAPVWLHGCRWLPPALQLCLWQISVPVGHVIDLHFHNFSLESHEDCSFDFVEVHDSTGTGAASLMGRYRHTCYLQPCCTNLGAPGSRGSAEARCGLVRKSHGRTGFGQVLVSPAAHPGPIPCPTTLAGSVATRCHPP